MLSNPTQRSPLLCRTLGLAVIAAGIAFAGPAEAQNHKELFKRGTEKFTKQWDYEGAAKDFEGAHTLSPKPRYLFAWAQSERLAGNCVRAVELYDEFLTNNPPKGSIAAAETMRLRCQTIEGKAKKRSKGAYKRGLTDGVIKGREKEKADAAARPPKIKLKVVRYPVADKWYKSPSAGALSAAGAVGIGFGIGLWTTSSNTRNTADNATTEFEFSRRIDQAKRERSAALLSLTAGTALLAGGITLYVLGILDKDEVPTVAAWVHDSGGGVTFAGCF